VNFEGLRGLGLWRLRWQLFLSAAATVAIVNAVVGGAFVALVVAYFAQPKAVIAILVGAVAAAILATAFLLHQWRTWMRVAVALKT
jgi:hypothetical protein